MKKHYLSECEATQLENQKLGEWYRDLQERYLIQAKLLMRAIKFIEKQSGATHYEDLVFIRRILGDFRILSDGSIERGKILDCTGCGDHQEDQQHLEF